MRILEKRSFVQLVSGCLTRIPVTLQISFKIWGSQIYRTRIYPTDIALTAALRDATMEKNADRAIPRRDVTREVL